VLCDDDARPGLDVQVVVVTTDGGTGGEETVHGGAHCIIIGCTAALLRGSTRMVVIVAALTGTWEGVFNDIGGDTLVVDVGLPHPQPIVVKVLLSAGSSTTAADCV
jgi:hypothetical protein